MKKITLIWITTAIACIMLTACRTNKQAAKMQQQPKKQQETAITNLSASTSLASRTETEQTAASESATLRTDTAYWQMVYPKTAKTEGDLWRRGNVYTLDTNEASWTVDTTFSLNVFFSIKMDESDSDFTYIVYNERLKCPRKKTFVSFVDSLQQLTKVERIDYHIPPVMLRDISQKVSGKI